MDLYLETAFAIILEKRKINNYLKAESCYLAKPQTELLLNFLPDKICLFQIYKIHFGRKVVCKFLND